ncbi:MAG: hypothetical protein WC679_13260 [Bacteroidales bacterium]|jgi:hypothetical protein
MKKEVLKCEICQITKDIYIYRRFERNNKGKLKKIDNMYCEKCFFKYKIKEFENDIEVMNKGNQLRSKYINKLYEDKE